MNILEVNHLSKSFNDQKVVDDVSFSLEQGEVLVIIGTSGSGKTTLLRCLNLLEFPDEGCVYYQQKKIFDGNERIINHADLIEKSKMFGLVFQSFNLFPHYNVLKNVTLASILKRKQSKESIDANAKKWLTRVGLIDKIGAYPNQLSGGQAQRVAIARALMLDPKILCFDEPTSALDPQLTLEVLNVIKDLKQTKMTMIIVTHELEFAKSIADKVIFMQEGKIVESGSVDDLFLNPKNEKTRMFIKNSIVKS